MVSRSRSVLVVAALTLVTGCGKNNPGMSTGDDDDDDRPPIDAAIDMTTGDPLKDIFNEVDGDRIIQSVKEMSGAAMVTVDGDTFQIDQRFDDAGRAKFRTYWTAKMTDLGIPVTPMHFDATMQSRATDDLEAVLPGKSADSYVIIVHYDSIGPSGAETGNPGADDDMSGMAILLETARLFKKHQAQLDYTIRFVASDAEELGGLRGARQYADYIKTLSTTEGFTIVGAIDDEQTGWNCFAEDGCLIHPVTELTFDIFDCSGDDKAFAYHDVGDAFEAVATKYSPLKVERHCMSQNSDHYAMWEIGVPTVVYSEHDPFSNPHFDQEGNDFFSAIDQDYLKAIGRIGITFQASLVGLGK